MKKQTQLLSALALSVGLTLSASFQAVASIPGQVADQAPLPSLAPMLEKVLPAVVSVRVEGTASQGQKIPEEFKKFFGDDLPDQPAQPFEGLGSGVIINAAQAGHDEPHTGAAHVPDLPLPQPARRTSRGYPGE